MYNKGERYNKDPHKRFDGRGRKASHHDAPPKKPARPARRPKVKPSPAPLSMPNGKRGCGVGCFWLLIIGVIAVIFMIVSKFLRESSKAEELFEEVQEQARIEEIRLQKKAAQAVDVSKSAEVPIQVTTEVMTRNVARPVESRKQPEAVDRKAEENAQVQKLIEQLKQNEDHASYYQALHELSRYSDNKEAFNALCAAALGHEDQKMRANALSKMNRFKSFDPAPTCQAILKDTGADESLQVRALQTVALIRYYNYEGVLIEALKHPKPGVRREAAQSLGRNKVKTATTALASMIQAEQDSRTRREALNALSYMNAPEALPILRADMTSKDVTRRRQAVQFLKLWRGQPEALDILAAHRNDPQLGDQIAAHLKQFGR
jgi:hypothetical protein